MQGDGYDRIDFEDPRTTCTVSQRGYKPVMARDKNGRTLKDKAGRPRKVYPWRVCVTYYVQDGTNEDGTPVWKRRQRNVTLPSSITTEKGAKDKQGDVIAKLKAKQDGAMANVAERREREEAERKAEEERKARAAKLSVWQCVDDYIDSSLGGGFIEASTAMDYRWCAKRIRSTLPDVPVDELTTDMLDEWQQRLSRERAHSTVKKTRNVLRVAVQDAMDKGRTTLAKNPVITTRKTIGQKRRDKATAPKLNALDKENRSILLAELDRMEDRPVTMAGRIGLYAGLREAEVCALLWSDVEIDADAGGGNINVNKSLGKSDAGLYVKPQKNDAEGRDIPMHPDLAKALARWKRSQQETAIRFGVDLSKTFVIGDPTTPPPAECFAYLRGTDRTAEDPEDADKLMGNTDARPVGAYNPATLSREWRTLARLSKARGMLGKPVSFHNLRHSFGYYCADPDAGGIERDQLAEWMGHESVTTTERYYIAKDKAASKARGRKAMEGMAARGVVRDSPAEVLPFKTGTAD